MSQAMTLGSLADGSKPNAGGSSSVPADRSIVHIEGLVKTFPLRRSWADTLRHPLRREQVHVLRGVSLEVQKGEFFGLLGPNGAGKTTLFKILATLVLPDAGVIEVGGRSVIAEPAVVRGMLTPVIAEERSLYWRLSGLQNLNLFSALYGVQAQEEERTAERLLDAVGLAHAGSRMVGTYSSGMKQRLLIARALLSRPAVLLLDEPTRSLDPVSARDFRRFLREEIVGRQGCTVLLATHDADEAFELCDRLAVLDRGVVIASGSAAELAAIAGENRYRILIAADRAGEAQRLLQSVGLEHLVEQPASEPGWLAIEGAIPGGAAACAELTRRLVLEGVSVSELSRVPLSLADLIERLVARASR
jgi:ABC-2 type transport system ATP-binding protein